jgi:hypothetical protein
MYPDLAAGSSRIASREQSCPRGTANRSGRIVVGEPDTLARERVDSRRFDFGRPIATEVVIPLIIDEDEDDIGASTLLIIRVRDRGVGEVQAEQKSQSQCTNPVPS